MKSTKRSKTRSTRPNAAPRSGERKASKSAPSRAVGIAELKAHLSAFLRRVRNGETITILDRDQPVAEMSPVQQARPALRIRPANPDAPPLGSFKLPSIAAPNIDIVEFLMDDRRRR